MVDLRDTSYAKELATAQVGPHRIERLYVKDPGQEEIRFSWWVDGKIRARPLDLPEKDLLPLMREAIIKGVFTQEFLRDLHAMLYEVRGEPKP